jgi:hypothetical protein
VAVLLVIFGAGCTSKSTDDISAKTQATPAGNINNDNLSGANDATQSATTDDAADSSKAAITETTQADGNAASDSVTDQADQTTKTDHPGIADSSNTADPANSAGNDDLASIESRIPVSAYSAVLASDMEKYVAAKQAAYFTDAQAKDVDPEISAIKIGSSDPDISVEKLAFIDKRDYAESVNWRINTLVKNVGSQPTYVNIYFGDRNGYNNNAGVYYVLLQSGETKWFNDTYIDTSINNNLTNLPKLYVVGHPTITPEIDPQFSNFTQIDLLCRTYLPTTNAFVELHSLKYIVSDESKGWYSLNVTLSAGDRDAPVCFYFIDKYGNNLCYDTGDPIGYAVFTIPAGQTKSVEMPLKNLKPEQLGGIVMKPPEENW